MKLNFVIRGACAATLLALGLNTAAADDARYIIKYKAGHGNSAKAAIHAAKAKTKLTLDHHRMIAANVPAHALKGLQNNPHVELVELDPKRELLAESTPYGIDMVQATQVDDAFVSNRKVCIVDTGYSLGHEDLISSGVTGNDGYGSNDTGDWFNDGHGHGTHVAGTISAFGGNNTGVVGVNRNGELQLHIVKVFNDSGSWVYGSDLVVAVDQCVSAGSNVISMSLGGGASSSAEQAAFDNALANGVLSIAAAGNDGNSAMSYPASYDSVMSVAAVDSNKSVANFSQYNSQVEIAAPGVDIMSTLPNNSYAAWSGTSMATPHVSGVAALVWSHHTECSASQIRNALNMTVEDRGNLGRDNYYGYGIVQAKATIDAIAAEGCDVSGSTTPPPTTGGELENGVAQTNLSGASGDQLNFTMAVPVGATNVNFLMTGGTGDADLYVKFGSAPTTSSYDCRPYKSGNEEICSSANDNGTYYVMLDGYTSFSGVSLTGNYTEDNGGANPPPVAIDLSVSKRIKRNRGFADLSWSGASTSNVDIYRNGSLVKTTANDGVWTNNLGKRPSGTYDYQVCDADSSDCSSSVSVSF